MIFSCCTPNSYYTCNGRANSERNTAEAKQEADGLTGTSLATEVKGNGAKQADEAAIKYTHAQNNQLQNQKTGAHCHQHSEQPDAEKGYLKEEIN